MTEVVAVTAQMLKHGQIICTQLQSDHYCQHTNTIFTGQMTFLPPDQQSQCTEGKINSVKYQDFENF